MMPQVWRQSGEGILSFSGNLNMFPIKAFNWWKIICFIQSIDLNVNLIKKIPSQQQVFEQYLGSVA